MRISFVVPVTCGNGSILNVRFRKKHSPTNLKMTAGLPLLDRSFFFSKNFLRVTQLCY